MYVRSLERPVADDRRAVHVAGEAFRVVSLGGVHGAAVVPEDEIAPAPFVLVDEFRPGAMVVQFRQ